MEVILGCKNRIYRNLGEGRFKAETLCPKFSETVFNVTLEDLSGDGVVDVVACGHDGIYLIEGEQGGTFQGEARLAWQAPEKVLDPMVMTTGDIDGDGDADLWLSQYKLPYVKGQMPTPIYDANDGFPGYLLLNDGTGRLTDATAAAGLAAKRHRRSYSASFADIDDDRDLDLVVVSDFAGVDLYLNDGSGQFTDATDRLVEESLRLRHGAHLRRLRCRRQNGFADDRDELVGRRAAVVDEARAADAPALHRAVGRPHVRQPALLRRRE